MLQGMTAHYLVTDAYPVAAGDPVVVHAAAAGGPVAHPDGQMRRGVVIATTSTPQKARARPGRGADHVAGYDDFGAVAREVTGGEGAALVYDRSGSDLSTAWPRCAPRVLLRAQRQSPWTRSAWPGGFLPRPPPTGVPRR